MIGFVLINTSFTRIYIDLYKIMGKRARKKPRSAKSGAGLEILLVPEIRT
jgi:hypothetical protein